MKKILAFTLAFILVLPGMLAFATDEGYGEDETALGQFVDTFEDLNNVSVRVLTELNSTLEAMELNFTAGGNDYEDFTTYAETDPANRLTQTATRSTFHELRRGDGDTRLTKDNGVGTIGLDFQYLFVFEITAQESGDADSRTSIRLLYFGNNAVNFATDPRMTLTLDQVAANDALFTMELRIDDTSAGFDIDNSIQLDVGTVYYVNLTRHNSGDDVTVLIYTGSIGGVLIDTLDVTIVNYSDDLMRYIMAPARKFSATDPNDWITGYIENLWNGSESGGYERDGYFSTVDYLSDPLANGSALVHLTNTTIPDGTGILIEFSEDNSTWIFNDWQPIFGGFEAIDLRDLNYSTGFYIRYNLSTENTAITPRIYQSRLITTRGKVSEGKPGLNVTGEWIEYNLTQIGVLVGILDDGDLNSTLDIDGDTFNVSEVVGAPGFSVSFNWTRIPDNADCLWFEIYYYYDGNQAHDLDVEIWNFTSSTWVFLDHIVDGVDFVWLNSSIYDLRIPNDFVNSSGAVLGRIIHAAAGNINHDIFIEYLKLIAFVPSGVAVAGVNWGLLWFFLILICIPIALVLLKEFKR